MLWLRVLKEVLRSRGVTPATIGILQGQVHAP